jgi:hypothetical protein
MCERLNCATCVMLLLQCTVLVKCEVLGMWNCPKTCLVHMNSVVSSKFLLHEGHICIRASENCKKRVGGKLCHTVPW